MPLKGDSDKLPSERRRPYYEAAYCLFTHECILGISRCCLPLQYIKVRILHTQVEIIQDMRLNFSSSSVMINESFTSQTLISAFLISCLVLDESVISLVPRAHRGPFHIRVVMGIPVSCSGGIQGTYFILYFRGSAEERWRE